MSNFYCQNVSGDVNFSIEEWNKAYEEIRNMPKEVKNSILHPPACKQQCFDCMAIVGERRNKTKNL